MAGTDFVTQDYLDTALTGLRTELRTEMGELRTELREQMQGLETRLMREIGSVLSHYANVMVEQTRTMVAAMDDRYADLPAATRALRHDLDEHRDDARIHRPPRRR